MAGSRTQSDNGVRGGWGSTEGDHDAYDMLDGMVTDGSDTPGRAGEPCDAIGDLLARVSSGDTDAFASVYDALSARVFGLVLRVVVDRAQSEEVVQEVFLEVWQSASRFSASRGRGRAWVFTIAHRRAVDRVRSSQAGHDRDQRIGRRDIDVAFDSVSETAEQNERAARVASALRELSDVQSEALTLAYFGGHTQREIAALTGVPLGTIKTRMRDGLKKLREQLGEGI